MKNLSRIKELIEKPGVKGGRLSSGKKDCIDGDGVSTKSNGGTLTAPLLNIPLSSDNIRDNICFFNKTCEMDINEINKAVNKFGLPSVLTGVFISGIEAGSSYLSDILKCNLDDVITASQEIVIDDSVSTLFDIASTKIVKEKVFRVSATPNENSIQYPQQPYPSYAKIMRY